MGKVYILILNWNNWKDTIECLESVFENSYPDYQVVVIDNASTDGSEKKITEWAEGKFNPDNKPIPYIRYDRETAEKGGHPEKEKILYQELKPAVLHPLIIIQTGENLGYAGGNNTGLRYALSKDDCDYIWLLNNDTVIDKNALTEMVRLAKTDGKTGMVGSKIFHYHNPQVLQAAGGGKLIPWMGNAVHIGTNEKNTDRWNNPMDLDFITGASLLVKKTLVEDIGLLDHRYFMYWEDVDWNTRARKKGYRAVYCPKSIIWHKEGGTSGGITPESDYYWSRNGLMFTKKFYPQFLPLVLLSYFAKYTLVRTLKRQPHNLKAFIKGVADFFKGRTGMISPQHTK